jgi:Baseplate J-like protein
VNAETVNLLNRPYAQIVDDILTAMVGGVVNEPIMFDVNRAHYPLSHPATDIRSVTGTVTVQAASGTPQVNQITFQIGVDYIFSQGDNSVAWVTGAAHPDDQSVFYVDYFRQDATAISPLTDVNIGSVTRTLSEAVGREIATVYEEINQAYLAGFVDTATGSSLDRVVSILGVVRKTKELAIGLVTFFRDTGSNTGSITIPQGTAMRTSKGVVFETSDLATLQLGQLRLDVPVRAGDASKGPAGIVKAGEINTWHLAHHQLRRDGAGCKR